MIVHMRRLWDWMKLFLLFVLFTMVGYILIGLLADWLKPSYRFEEPAGRAIKVSSFEKPNSRLSGMSDWERLKLYYWTGE